jgi:hypothetical protein
MDRFDHAQGIGDIGCGSDGETQLREDRLALGLAFVRVSHHEDERSNAGLVVRPPASARRLPAVHSISTL